MTKQTVKVKVPLGCLYGGAGPVGDQICHAPRAMYTVSEGGLKKLRTSTKVLKLDKVKVKYLRGAF